MEGMGMSKAEVTGQCVKIYKREGVRTGEGLREKMQKSGCTDEGRESARVGMGG